jgi:Fe2+ transport system protein FeoA
MKFIVILATCLGLSFAAPQPFSLVDDLDDFLNLIDLDQIEALLEDNLQDNGDIIEIATYMKGDEWAGLVAYVRDHPGWMKLKEWLISKGISVDAIVSEIHDYIQNAELGTASGDRDVNTFLTDLEALIPVDDLLSLAVTKLITSPDFQDLFNRVKSEDTHGLVDDVLSLDEVKADIARLTEMGVDVQGILETVYGLLEWGAPPKAVKKSGRTLADDLQEFIDLLPLDDILAIADDHLQTDGAFVAVVLYLQGPEWTELVETVGAMPAVQDFIQFLNDAGLPVDDILAWIDDLIKNAVPGTDADEEGSLRPILDEVEAILPLTELLALVNDKLQNSPDFQALYVEVSSEKAHTLVEEVRALDEVQTLAQRLISMGVKVEEALAWVYDFLGWGEPKLSKSGRTLADDLQEFIDLLPLDDIQAIADDHLATDGAFAAVVLYLQGPEWTELVETVGAKPAVQDFIQYLTDAGLPVDDILAWIDNLITGATPGTDPDEEGSLRPLLDEIEAILPLADLLALLNDKLQNSPDFQALYVEVSSEKAHTLVEEVRALDEVQTLAQRLISMGVKVEEALAVVYEFLGWGEPKKF